VGVESNIQMLGIFLFATAYGSGARPASYAMSTGDSFPYSRPSSSEVKNASSCTFTPPIHLHGVVPS